MLAFFSNLYQNKRAMTAARNSAQDAPVDALVIGGGFYGAAIAVYLARQRGLKRVLLVEREAALLARASHRNPARVHNGYHYPRSLTTAYRSRVHSPKFVQRWPQAIQRDFTALYAIARRNSKSPPGSLSVFAAILALLFNRRTLRCAHFLNRV